MDQRILSSGDLVYFSVAVIYEELHERYLERLKIPKFLYSHFVKIEWQLVMTCSGFLWTYRNIAMLSCPVTFSWLEEVCGTDVALCTLIPVYTIFASWMQQSLPSIVIEETNVNLIFSYFPSKKFCFQLVMPLLYFERNLFLLLRDVLQFYLCNFAFV